MPNTYPDHLVIHDSPLSVKDSIDALKFLLDKQGVKVFARFLHSELAHKDGLVLNDIEVLVFGNPKVGTFLMQDDPLIAIELPLRILAWETSEGTKLAYEDLATTASSYQIETHHPVIEKIRGWMKDLFKNAIERSQS